MSPNASQQMSETILPLDPRQGPTVTYHKGTIFRDGKRYRQVSVEWEIAKAELSSQFPDLLCIDPSDGKPLPRSTMHARDMGYAIYHFLRTGEFPWDQ